MKKILFLVTMIGFLNLSIACSDKTAKANQFTEKQENSNNFNADIGLNLKFKKIVYNDGRITINYPKLLNYDLELVFNKSKVQLFDNFRNFTIYFPYLVVIKQHRIYKKMFKNYLKFVFELNENRLLSIKESINKIIEEHVLSYIQHAKETENLLLMHIDYIFEIINNKIISICFTGWYYMESSPYPTSLFETLNIDISNKKRLNIEDIFKVNTDLVEIIKKNAKNVSGISENDSLLKKYNSNKMLKDIKTNVFVFLRRKSIIFSFPVIHALGDYANFEIEYKYLRTSFISNKLKPVPHYLK
ncbi:MAG: hypothetical protein LBJ32_04525 [Oscillospiraceae bacterium]|jgi:outer membrane lipoprotein-sorting protein|nr:hypothetical protein [Oscillospiraceae bacterium]